MPNPRSGHKHMTVAPEETIKARDDAEASIERARNLVIELLAERGEAPISEVLQYLADKGIRSDGAISDALTRLLTAGDVDLDENRQLRLER
jgi:hypothetical protein